MNTSSSIVNCRLFISIQIMNFVIILQFNEANKVKTGRIKRKYLLRGGSTSFQAKQTSGRVSSTDPKRLLFIKFIYSRLALLLLALQENAFDSDIRICSLHSSAVSKVSFLPLIRKYLSWWNWQQMLTSLKIIPDNCHRHHGRRPCKNICQV